MIRRRGFFNGWYQQNILVFAEGLCVCTRGIPVFSQVVHKASCSDQDSAFFFFFFFLFKPPNALLSGPLQKELLIPDIRHWQAGLEEDAEWSGCHVWTEVSRLVLSTGEISCDVPGILEETWQGPWDQAWLGAGAGNVRFFFKKYFYVFIWLCCVLVGLPW